MPTTDLDQMIGIVEKYVEEAKVDPSAEVAEVKALIEEKFIVPEKRLERIADILSKSKLKQKTRDVKLSEADRLMLQGLALRTKMRMGKKLREIIDFETGAIDPDAFLKALVARKKREEKAQSAQ